MPISHAVLGLLAKGPSYGYELKTSFEEAIGPQWGELNIGHLYQVLERLMRDRLVSRREVPQADRPDKLVYRLTKAGRLELERWLETPFIRRSGYRDDFFLKLFVGARLGEPRLIELLRSQRRAYLDELAGLGDLEATHGNQPLVRLLIDAAKLHTEANLKLVDLAEEKASTLAEAYEHGLEVDSADEGLAADSG
jgi:DNA-binding PadR family transcriptional regulator